MKRKLFLFTLDYLTEIIDTNAIEGRKFRDFIALNTGHSTRIQDPTSIISLRDFLLTLPTLISLQFAYFLDYPKENILFLNIGPASD